MLTNVFGFKSNCTQTKGERYEFCVCLALKKKKVILKLKYLKLRNLN